jgi:hypothetical protein
MASGIIEYLAEGTWTKRMHAGWAAQAGIRAALLARAGSTGPRTVLEGTHGFFRAFAPSIRPDFARLLEGLGTNWLMPSIAFKSYACGTMTQPYIDCVIALAERGISVDQIMEIVCKAERARRTGSGSRCRPNIRRRRLMLRNSARRTACCGRLLRPPCRLQPVHRGANSRSSRPRPPTQDPL